MRYYFLRHGIAEELADSDFNRALTARGAGRVAKSGAVMKRLNIRPTQIFSSPRLRARETAEIVAAALGLPVTLADELDFGFDLADIRSLTAELGAGDEVMFVGHNPDMSSLAHQLTGVNVAMKKGGLARVDVFGKKARQGELIWLIAPKVFDALSDASGPLDADAMPPAKLPSTAYPVHDLIKGRWSPVGFDRERGINRATLLSILEAARWAASSFNRQPWRFIVAPRENAAEFQKVLSVLREGNQVWAQHAAVLMIAVVQQYQAPDAINRHAGHDLGQAVAQMTLQALDQDIYVHQMAGFFPDKAREIYAIPEAYEPYTAIALGYRSCEIDHLPAAYREREAGERLRQPLNEMVYSGNWGRAADFLG